MRKVALVGVVGIAVAAARRVAALRKSMSAVAPELRTPAILVTGIPMNTLTLPIVRLLMGIRTSPGPAVTLSEHRVGDAATDVLVLTPRDHACAQACRAVDCMAAECRGLTAQLETQPSGQLAEATRRSRRAARTTGSHPSTRSLQRLDDCMDDPAVDGEERRRTRHRPRPDRGVGTSAGGGLAAAVAQRSHRRGNCPAGAGRSSTPMIDDRTALRDDHAGRGQLAWTPASNGSGLDRLPGPRAADVRRARVRRARPPRGPGRACRRPGSASATSTCSTTRTSPTPRGWRPRACRAPDRHRSRDVPHGRTASRQNAQSMQRVSRQHGRPPAHAISTARDAGRLGPRGPAALVVADCNGMGEGRDDVLGGDDVARASPIATVRPSAISSACVVVVGSSSR